MRSFQKRAGEICPCCGAEGGRRHRLGARHPVRTLQKQAFEAFTVTCMDPRMQEPIRLYLAERGLAGRYSQFTIAGGAIGIVAPSFEAWHATFWDNLDVTVKLHRVKRVIAINHRNCGAGSIAFGPEKFAGRAAETATHHQVLAAFREQVARHHPRLVIETGLMALDGSIMMFK